jgi:hypothetical protein
MSNNSLLKGLNKYLIYVAAFIVLCVIYYFQRYGGLTDQSVFIPLINIDQSLPIPPRPGINGITLSGPDIPNRKFEINTGAAGLKPLDWNHLIFIDRLATVKVFANVGADGFLTLQKIQDAGHPDAGDEIRKIMATWSYTTYKKGPIRFYINVASTGNQLIVDKNNLVLSNPSGNPVIDGQLYYTTGLNAGKVGYGTIAGN